MSVLFIFRRRISNAGYSPGSRNKRRGCSNSHCRDKSGDEVRGAYESSVLRYMAQTFVFQALNSNARSGSIIARERIVAKGFRGLPVNP